MKNMTGKFLTYWCWICHAARQHMMIPGTEKGYCTVCETLNWQPKGDID